MIGQSSRSPLPRALRPLTVPASRVYGALIAARNRRYDRGRGVQRVDRPVVSVGNITTGGTGKTPMVAWIARYLLSQAREPVIAMRGYKARPNQPSDEEAEYGAILPDVAVLVNPDRTAALREFLREHPEIDCVLMDDGFQHRQLHRDLDLVLIDATRDTFHDDLLPSGHLREPVESLSRADAVIVTRAAEVDEALAQHIERWHGTPPIAWAKHAWTQLWIYSSPRFEPEPTTWLSGKRIVTLLGTGNPHSILEQVEAAEAKVMANVPAGDHEHYERAKLIAARDLCGGGDGLFMTRKDWVKVEPLLASGRMGEWRVPIIIPQVDIEFIAGEDALRQMLLRAVPHGCRDG